LKSPPERITVKFLEQYPEFVTFQTRRSQSGEELRGAGGGAEPETPEEALEAAHVDMRAGLASELLNRIKASSPQFFERLVIELLLRMGYGGSS
jgi:restriction system protein